jgi:hypothetical protein
MEDELKHLKIEDDLNFENGRRPHFFNGRQPQYYENGRKPHFFLK